MPDSSTGKLRGMVWGARIALALLVLSLLPSFARAVVLPQGFQEITVWSGLTAPTAIRFASDGRVFVAEKGGRIKVFTSLADPTPDVFVDLSTNVYDYWDKGLLGLALDPSFPASPYVYVLYTYDYDPATPGIPAPRWGDACPTPPGDTADGCVVNGRLSRLQINASNQLVGAEQVLLENNWCQQYPSHSIGDLVFDTAGALLASAGDGASFDFVDYGQGGGSAGSPTPKNPCGDPPSGRGGTQPLPGAEGGALRSQDLRTPSDPVTFDGSILRINPATGAAWPDNPLVGGSTGDDRTIAYGLRNPFRMTARPGTSEIWIGEVGYSDWEEINRIVSPSDATVENFGWPCYEGTGRQPSYDGFNLDICENLYAAGAGAVQAPYYTYRHGVDITPGGDNCGTGSSAISGIAFYPASTFPSTYTGALFFADYGRSCIYVMRAGAGGNPDVATRTVFDQGAATPVDLRVGPGGDLFYADIEGGTVRRIHYTSNNTPPTAVIQASPTAGPLPLLVQFDGSGSFDPDPGATLTYAWDLDNDGQYDDSTAVSPSRNYSSAGPVTVRLRVTDNQSATGTASVVIYPGNSAPSATIVSPPSSLTWRVGDAIAFSGTGNDPETGAMPASSMHWDIVLHHCPGGTSECHNHVIQQLDGVASGTFVAPDHEWYSYLEFRLRVTDAVGLQGQATVDVDPASVLISYDTVPSGLSLTVANVEQTTPFTRPAIVGSLNSISAPGSQALAGESYAWLSWSNGGPQSQEILAGSQPASYVATYTNDKILVVAPHPGDEVCMSAGVIFRARGSGVAVRTVFLTNGDAGTGQALGLVRQAEAVDAAVDRLGMTEDSLVFLGYPESYLATLDATVPGPAGFTTPWGQSETYGNRGLGGMDYHTYRFGSPAAYNRANLVADLADLVGSLRPTHIVVPSPADRDFDHEAAYSLLMAALQLVHGTNPGYAPTVHTTILRTEPPAVPPSWPNPTSPTTPFAEPADLSLLAPLGWVDRESLDVPAEMQATPLAANVKDLAVEEYASLGGDAGFLGRFLHKDEFFWVESPLDPNHPPHVDAGSDQNANEGAQVQLHGDASSDGDADPLVYQWRQTSGTTVALSDSTAALPTFTAPSNGDEVLGFELRVSDGTFLSLPDSVQVRVHPAANATPVANAGSDRNVFEGALVQLDGSASSDANGDPLAYQWTQTSGPTVQLSDATSPQPTFLAPAGLLQNQTAAFRLVVSDGVATSAPDTVNVTISWSANVAPLSVATASSESAIDGSFASSAIDRVVDGYPGDDTKEWTTVGEHAGAWIELDWSRSYLVDHVTLYDRPNTDDRVTGGTLLFSNGTMVSVGSLTNNGTGVTINFSQRLISSVKFTVTSVSASTVNVGLAELEVYRKQGQTDVDQDGFSAAEGDCNDSDRFVNPAVAEIPYNGKDDDCNAATRSDDLDGDGVPFATDCNDSNPMVRTTPAEVTPLLVDRSVGAARLGWPSIAAAAGTETAYDVVSGDLDELRTDADYARAGCFLSRSHATTWDDFREAPLPLGLYYLVRGKNSCGAGTFGNARIVPDPRDGLDASGPCP